MSRHLILCALSFATLSVLPRAQTPTPVTAPVPRQEPNLGGPVDLASQDVRVAESRMRMAPGYRINLFASEAQFPELANPLAMAFDAKGRLWVLTAPSYPHVLPGQQPDDKLLILDDTDRDGRADTIKVFADKLYLPTGFELGDGGAYVSQQPNLMFLKDTNGDDRADERSIVLHGFGTEDSHHAIHAFTWGAGGGLYFQEGTFLHSQVETPRGPVRLENAGVFRYEPRTETLDVFVSYSFANPWGHVVDGWGQHFVSDASNGNNYFGTAFSGRVVYPAKQKAMKEWTDTKVRPTAGIEFVSSRHFPDAAQGNFLINNNIGFQGIKQYRVTDDGAGFAAKEIEPLLQATDPNFRPVALRFGPDGALYVVDWFNPLVGHMQYSIRDARRDTTHGRVWRITAENRPLVERPVIAGQSIEAQLELLKVYEDRTRYLARLALRDQPKEGVLRALGQWTAALDRNHPDYEHRLLEALWVHQHHDAVELGLLNTLLAARDPRARAGAVRVLHYWRDRVPDAMAILTRMVHDTAPRVRLEAVLALSYVPTLEATDAALEVLDHPMDDYLRYALDSAVTTLARQWKTALAAGRVFAGGRPQAQTFLHERLKPIELVTLPGGAPDLPVDPSARRIRISAVLDQMKFDVPRFTVKPGETIEIVLFNPDVMPHNLVITAPGRLEAVGKAAEAMAALPDGFQKQFVPDTADVLFATRLINQNQTARLRVVAPTRPGEYPYTCTFPGHWLVMKGIMEVVR